MKLVRVSMDILKPFEDVWHKFVCISKLHLTDLVGQLVALSLIFSVVVVLFEVPPLFTEAYQ